MARSMVRGQLRVRFVSAGGAILLLWRGGRTDGSPRSVGWAFLPDGRMIIDKNVADGLHGVA